MHLIRFFVIVGFIILNHVINGQGIAIGPSGSAPEVCAILDLQSTSKGLLLPRMSTEQRGDIQSPIDGLLVYDTDLQRLMFYESSDWKQVYMFSESQDPGTYYYRDFDDDGFGNAEQPVFVFSGTSPPEGYVTDNTDCDDTDPDIYPGATEICDGKDNDCDPTTPDGSGETPDIICLDHGVCVGVSPTCGGDVGWICNYGPDYEEEEVSCDGKDNDCDGEIDEGCDEKGN